MARETYRDELTALRGSVLTLGEDVLAQLEGGLDALAEGDQDRAERVIEGDGAINDRYLALESDCIDLLALQQPVASDLRFVAASFKILTDLERIGDLATNLAEYARWGVESDLEPVDVRAIGAETVAMVEAALDAYESEDADACRQVAARDDDIDALCQRAGERVVRELIRREAGAATAGPGEASDRSAGEASDRSAGETSDTAADGASEPGEAVGDGPTDAWETEALMQDVSRALLTVRDLERVGDHAVNVAARTLYLVETDPSLIY